jgi:hypothetical protein
MARRYRADARAALQTAREASLKQFAADALALGVREHEQIREEPRFTAHEADAQANRAAGFDRQPGELRIGPSKWRISVLGSSVIGMAEGSLPPRTTIRSCSAVLCIRRIVERSSSRASP